jgi:hypothetical protein
MKPMLTIALLAVLAGCAKSPAELEVADDASCRKIIAERNDTRITSINGILRCLVVRE